MTKMLEATFNFLGLLANQKKLVGGWLIMLTLALGQMGEKVYVQRTKELATVETQVGALQATVMGQLEKMDVKLDANGEKLQTIIIEQARVRQELAAHREITAAQLMQLKEADTRLEAEVAKHLAKP